MSDQQPPNGPQDPNPPSDPEWGPPSPTGPAPGAFGQPSPPAAEQPPAYPGPTSYGAQPPGQQPFGQQPFGQQPYGDPAYGDVVANSARGNKRGLALGAGALALAAVAAGGVYFATQAGDDGGGQPEALVPATAYAFAKVDLDPPADQKVAIHEFTSKFPQGPKTTADNPVDGLLTEMFKDESGKCTYAADIKPWLGKRVAVAAVPNTSGKTQPLLLLQVKDDAKAKAALDKIRSGACDTEGEADDEFKGFTIRDGYAVLGNTQADVDGALTSAKSKSLKDNGTFTDDIGKLNGNQVIVVWADIARGFEEAAKANPQLNQLPNGVAKQIKGRLALGMHLSNNYAEIYGRVIGADTSSVKVSKPTNLTRLPKDTVVAVSVSGLQEQIESQLTQLGATGEDIDSLLAQTSEQLGVDIRKDLLPLLGSETLIALGNLPTSPTDAKFGLVTTVTDPAAAGRVGTKIADIAKSQGIELDAQVEGSTFYLTTKGYAETLKGDGGLGSSPAFTAAMGSLGDEVSGALFIDIGQLMKLRGAEAEDAASHISGFGASAGKDGGDAYMRMRLVVK